MFSLKYSAFAMHIFSLFMNVKNVNESRIKTFSTRCKEALTVTRQTSQRLYIGNAERKGVKKIKTLLLCY